MVDFFVAFSGRFLTLFFPVFYEQNRGYIISPLWICLSHRKKNPLFSPRIFYKSWTLQYHRSIALLALLQAPSAQGIVVLSPGIGIQKEIPLQLCLLRHSRHTVTSSPKRFFISTASFLRHVNNFLSTKSGGQLS
jgi:hypothetical protein